MSDLALTSCPFCSFYEGSLVERVHGYDAYCPSCGVTISRDTEKNAADAWNSRVENSDNDITDMDVRMKARGMIPLTQLLAGTPLDRWRAHTGVTNIKYFQQWAERKQEEYMKMRMRYEVGDKDKDDDMYEWIFAHAAVYGEVVVNLKQALNPGIFKSTRETQGED